MQAIAFTDFRKHASKLFSQVENGAAMVVLRHGKPIAEISPVSDKGGAKPSWKKPGLKLAVPGAGLTKAILEERKQS